MNSYKKFSVDICVRFKDIDSMGHVNNAVFFTFFEEGRKAFLNKILNIPNPDDYNFILAHISCDFLKPVKINDQITLQLWIGETGNKSFTFIYKLINNKNSLFVYAKGKSVQVSFDYKKNCTIPVPNEFFDKISEYIEEDKK
ncbi:thioesterase family protein [Desulfobacula sp.]|uniref:acyl-CoA thioesterase n=1 Tax=Desulfobacula sp. TaxID=2593537 RepID=UPI0026273067|nr:thioesterase family protein [Desulfobacula sp.]